MSQPSIDVGQRLLSQKSDYPYVTHVSGCRPTSGPILKYSSSGELGCKDFFAIIVSEHIGLLLLV